MRTAGVPAVDRCSRWSLGLWDHSLLFLGTALGPALPEACAASQFRGSRSTSGPSQHSHPDLPFPGHLPLTALRLSVCPWGQELAVRRVHSTGSYHSGYFLIPLQQGVFSGRPFTEGAIVVGTAGWYRTGVPALGSCPHASVEAASSPRATLAKGRRSPAGPHLS